MLAFVAIILIVGLIQSGSAKPLASHLPSPQRPLTKPEPSTLLNRADLRLSNMQRDSIRALSVEWSADKAKLLTAMSAYQPRQGRADQLSGSLEGYSELSRTYDATRSQYWDKAYALLEPKQRAIFAGEYK